MADSIPTQLSEKAANFCHILSGNGGVLEASL
jgi:hypothetical protein